MKILVTGPDGLLGSNLVRVLLEQGHSVRALVHPQSQSGTLEGLPLESVRGDIVDGDSVAAALQGCDAVIHGAASTAMWPPRDPKNSCMSILRLPRM